MPLLKNQKAGTLEGVYSSFTTVEKILSEVVQRLMNAPRLVKLLYYTDKHALSGPELDQDQIYGLLNHQIKIVPDVNIETQVTPCIVIGFTQFSPQLPSTEFRNVRMYIDIICPYESWALDNFKLRPYSIAGEVDALLNHSSITKTGIADFMGASETELSKDLGSVVLYYQIEAMTDDLQDHSKEAPILRNDR